MKTLLLQPSFLDPPHLKFVASGRFASPSLIQKGGATACLLTQVRQGWVMKCQNIYLCLRIPVTYVSGLYIQEGRGVTQVFIERTQK